ncbi:MAG: phenylalanine--tRNA ligase subunit beta [Synergistaceae bacterium]|nr:phenylalanine--tRNA ligase subunit beta [Synergistaceae bacterium]
MIVSWRILERFVSVPASPEEAAQRLTMSGAEVESVKKPGAGITGVVVARIDSLERHISKENLLTAGLDTGKGKITCVTAATNLKAGDKVFYGAPGAVLPSGELGARDFDGVRSEGMMLSGAELGLPDIDVVDGILVLPDDAPIGADARALYGIGDTLLDVSVTPNRGDLLSILGVARELKGLYPDAALKTMPWEKTSAEEKAGKEWPFEFGAISLPDAGCLNYHLGLALDAAIAPSPLEVRVALARMGMRPISNVVDATNYVMLVLGQPLHAFDLNTLPAREITVRSASEGERIVTLDGKERVMTANDMLITSGGEPIAIAGVMGGGQTGIADDTKTVVLESANFSARRVGHTSRRLGMTSEAAFRYSRGVDPTLSAMAIDYALMLMNEWSGAEIGYSKNSAFNEYPKIEPVILTKRKLHTYLLWSDMEESVKILEGYGIRKDGSSGPEAVAFAPPTWRPDIAIEEDLIEEIGRYRGYNDAPDLLPGELPRRGTIGASTALAGELRACAAARGYVEAITYSFLPESFVSALRLPEDDPRARPLLLANPISQDWTAMRTTLLPGLLNGLKESVASGWRGPVRLFETGRVFMREPEGSGNPAKNRELDTIAGLVCNGVDPRTPWGDAKEDFLSVKADVEALLYAAGHGETVIERGSEPFGHAGQTASIKLRGEKIGYLARLSPSIERELDFTSFGESVYVFEVNLSALGEAAKPKYAPASPFPAVFRDISMLAPEEATHDGVIAEIRALASDNGFLDSVKLFDVYSGKGIPEGRRSMAFSLCYRAADRTLNDEEVDKIHNSIRDALTQKGYNMR